MCSNLLALPLELLWNVFECMPVGSLFNLVLTCKFLNTVTTKILYQAITISFAPPSMDRMEALIERASDIHLSYTQELQIGILYEDCPPRGLRYEEWDLLRELLEKLTKLRKFIWNLQDEHILEIANFIKSDRPFCKILICTDIVTVDGERPVQYALSSQSCKPILQIAMEVDLRKSEAIAFCLDILLECRNLRHLELRLFETDKWRDVDVYVKNHRSQPSELFLFLRHLKSLVLSGQSWGANRWQGSLPWLKSVDASQLTALNAGGDFSNWWLNPTLTGLKTFVGELKEVTSEDESDFGNSVEELVEFNSYFVPETNSNGGSPRWLEMSYDVKVTHFRTFLEKNTSLQVLDIRGLLEYGELSWLACLKDLHTLKIRKSRDLGRGHPREKQQLESEGDFCSLATNLPNLQSLYFFIHEQAWPYERLTMVARLLPYLRHLTVQLVIHRSHRVNREDATRVSSTEPPATLTVVAESWCHLWKEISLVLKLKSKSIPHLKSLTIIKGRHGSWTHEDDQTFCAVLSEKAEDARKGIAIVSALSVIHRELHGPAYDDNLFSLRHHRSIAEWGPYIRDWPTVTPETAADPRFGRYGEVVPGSKFRLF